MRPGSLIRSSPFRLAVAFGFLFVAAFLGSILITYQSVKTDLAERLDQTITEMYSVIVASYTTRELEDLITSVESHARIAEPEGSFVTLVGSDGKILAGTITKIIPRVGWSTVPAGDLGISEGEVFRIYSGKFDGRQLAVGMSYADTDEMLEIALTSFGWGFLFVVISVIGGSIFLASRMRRRMDAIALTMTRVSHGELGSRIPLVGNGDDIDTLSVQINAALDRLAALVESMRQVSNDIAHDLKTPLNRLRLIVESAMEKEESGLPIAADLADARAESDKINETFDALLRIAQIESGSRKSRFVGLRLDDILSSIAEIYMDVASDAGLSLNYRSHSVSQAWIVGDRELLLQLFANLIENSIRHCPAGTAIHLTLERFGNDVVVEVRDNGPGIPEHERENVLRRLYRLDKSRTTPGTGLGLSLVKAISDLHGATLRLEDADPGLKVTLRFPPAS